jgi:hypothetical protein
VPRFYFDVRQDENVISDDEGSEFESLDAAVHAAAEIGTDRLAKGDPSNIAIGVDVRDEQNHRVCTVTPSMKIDWHVPQQRGPHSWSA